MTPFFFLPLFFFFPGCEKEWDGGSGPSGSVGTQLGQQAVNFTLPDQNNLLVSLYDYSGLVVLIQFSHLD